MPEHAGSGSRSLMVGLNRPAAFPFYTVRVNRPATGVLALQVQPNHRQHPSQDTAETRQWPGACHGRGGEGARWRAVVESSEPTEDVPDRCCRPGATPRCRHALGSQPGRELAQAGGAALAQISDDGREV